jgi:hypothetical protein
MSELRQPDNLEAEEEREEMTAKSPETLLVTLTGEFEDVHGFELKLRNAIRMMVGREFAAGTVDKPEIAIEVVLERVRRLAGEQD